MNINQALSELKKGETAARIRRNNFSYSTNPEVNFTSVQIANGAAARRAGNTELAARMFLSAIAGRDAHHRRTEPAL